VKYSRITVVQTVYFESQEGGQPFAHESKFSRLVDTDEQHWFRRMRVGDGWKPLDIGWIKGCSLMVLENAGDAPIILSVREPDGYDCILLPEQSLRWEPVALGWIKVKCPEGKKSTLNVVLFPDGKSVKLDPSGMREVKDG
jgi:hypothetical protein